MTMQHKSLPVIGKAGKFGAEKTEGVGYEGYDPGNSKRKMPLKQMMS